MPFGKFSCALCMLQPKRQMEREKLKVEEQTGRLEEENRLMREKHKREIQAMNNQLLEANKASDQSKEISMEVVRKEMEMMKQEYEGKLGDLAKQISAFKERKAGQAAPKKKKVSFALPCDVSLSATESRDDKKEGFDFADEPRSVYDSFYKTSSRSSKAGGEALGKDDGLTGLGSDATLPHRLFKCAPSKETSARSEDHSGAAGSNAHPPSSFKFLAPAAVKSGELSARGKATAAPSRQNIFKFVARPSGNSALGLASDFSTFALQQQQAVGEIYLLYADAHAKLH